MMKKYDAVIIGRGPAGLSASLYTSRANLRTVVLGTENSSLAAAREIENYFGFAQPVSGKKLLEEGEAQAKKMGVSILNDEVTGIAFENGFTVKTTGGSYAGTSVLIATGQPRNKVNIEGLGDFEGSGVSYCTTCDGFFYRNKSVGILGSGNYAVEEAGELEAFTKDITLFTNGEDLNLTAEYAQAASKYKVDKRPIKKLAGGKTLDKIVFADGETKIDGLFIACGSASSVDFAVKMGILVKGNAMIVNENQQTSIEGIFAAGDCCASLRQVSVAVGQGAVAGRAMVEYIRKAKKAAEKKAD